MNKKLVNIVFLILLSVVVLSKISEADPTVVLVPMIESAYEAGQIPAKFTLILSEAAASDITVNYSAEGTATAGSDYYAIGTNTVISAGQTTKDISIIPIDDTDTELKESVFLQLVAGTGYSIVAPSSGTVYILSDESAPTISISAVTSTAYEAGQVTGKFRLTLSAAATSDTVVNYTVSGTASSGSDYTAIGISIVIPAGQTTKDISITPIDDTAVESNETVIVTLGNGTGYSVGSPNNATVMIVSDEVPLPTVSISAPTSTGYEAGAVAGKIRLTLSAAPAGDTVINFTVTGTAAPGSDYYSIGTSTVILAGHTTTDIDIIPKDDAVIESNESVVVTLGAGAGYTVGAPSNATVNIADNDLAIATISAVDATAYEAGQVEGKFRITMDRALSFNTVVYYSVSGTAVSGSDYFAIGTSTPLIAGQTTMDIVVKPIDDMSVESDESVYVVLSSTIGTGYSVGSPNNATVMIVSDELPLPTLSISAPASTGYEAGAVAGKIRLTLSAAAAGDTVINFTVAGTAASGSDYYSIGTSTVILAGRTTTDLDINPIDDAIVESNESVIVTLGNGTGYTVGTPNNTTVTIVSDDIAIPTVSINASTSPAYETGPTPGKVRLTLSAASTSDITVNYTVTGTASSGSDFVSIGVSAIITAGQTIKDISINPINDVDIETLESVIVTLGAGAGYTVGAPNNATVNIVDNDLAVATISAVDATAYEAGQVEGKFRITLDRALSFNTMLYYSVSGTAVSGSDYFAIGTSTPLIAGQTTMDIIVKPIDDMNVESDESVYVVLSSTFGTGYAVGTPYFATVIIVSDDVIPTVSISAPVSTAYEACSEPGKIRLTLSAAAVSDTLVNYTVAGTATSGSDYYTIGASAVIGAGQTTKEIDINPIDDTLVESNESVVVTLGSGTGYTVGMPNNTTVTIVSDDKKHHKDTVCSVFEVIPTEEIVQNVDSSGGTNRIGLKIEAGTIDQIVDIKVDATPLMNRSDDLANVVSNANEALNECGKKILGSSIVEFKMYDKIGNLVNDFKKNITIMLPYEDQNEDGIVDSSYPPMKVENLRVYSMRDGDDKWEEVDCNLDKVNKMVIAKVSHFSLYAIVSSAQAKTNLTNVIAYPNPYRPGSGTQYDNSPQGNGIILSGLTGNAYVRIYNVAGELVSELRETNGDGELIWDTKNTDGSKVASGIYLYLITDPGMVSEKAKGKISVIR